MSWAYEVNTSALDISPPDWRRVPLWTILKRRDITGREDAELLSVYRDHGVIPKSSRDDNFNKPSEDLSTYRFVERGDLVLNKMKTWQGSLAVSNYEGIVSPAYIVCELSPEVESRFVHHLLRSDPYINLYQSVSKGIRPNQWDLPFDEFKMLPISVPPVEEQRRIADFLDAETNLIRRAVEIRVRQLQLLIDQRAQRFSLHLERIAGIRLETLDLERSLTDKWQYAPLSKVLRQLTNGYVGPTRDILVQKPGVRYLQSLHIKQGHIDFYRKPYYVSRAWASSRPRISLGSGDVLIVQTGSIGEVALVEDEMQGASCHALLIARPDRSVLMSHYLVELLRSYWGKSILLREQTGALHPHLEAGKVRDIRIPVPALNLQERIAQDCQRDEQSIALAQDVIDRQLKLLTERQQALITAAVTGQIDVTTARGVDVS